MTHEILKLLEEILCGIGKGFINRALVTQEIKLKLINFMVSFPFVNWK